MLRYVFVFLIAIHAAIHLIGFAKAFGLAEVTSLPHPIPRSEGIVWLIATALFTAVIPLFLARIEWWPIVAVIAVMASQTAIVLDWQDAKFGTVANAIILAAFLAGFGLAPSRDSDGIRHHDIAAAPAGQRPPAFGRGEKA